MPGAAIGALLGFALSGTGLGIGLAGFLGVSAGTLWMVGASLGSLFDGPDIDLGGSTPNYTFGQLSNTKSQMLPIPIVYGRCRVGGNVFMQTFYDDTLQKMDMLVGVSEGPIQSIKSIYASDTELTDVNGDITHELEEVTLNVHLGEPGQVADSRDPSGSTYANVAYVGLTLKAQDGLSGNPTISSIVEGRKIWTPAGTMFSRNPAWIVYDFLTNTRYGVGIPTDLIDLDSFMASADYCDALVEGEPRFTLDYIIDTQRPAVDHLQSMLACFRGYFLARDKIELHVEQAGSVYKALGPDNFVKDSFTWWQKSGDDSPNRITLEWIDPDNHYEQSSAVFEYQEDMQARGVFEKSFSVLGVTRSSQVGRLGNYLMETAKRVQNFCSFQVGLQDADIEAGEIISLTYPDFTGWDSKPFRVVAVQDHGDSGLVTITCAEYDATVYGDDALPVQTPIVDPTPVTYDDVYSLALEDMGHIADDGTWFPVIRATWQNPSDYTPAALNIRWRYSGDTVWNLHLNTSRLTTQTNITGLTTGEDLEVWVNCVKPNNGRETTGATATLSVGRDVTPPAAPTSLTATGWFGSINLEWVNPADRDLSHIEVWENAIDNRATAVKIAETKGTSYQRYVGSFITRYYWVRAVDFSGNVGAWNATAGTAGNSDQKNHQDFVDLVLQENPYLAEVQTDLNSAIVLGDTNIKTIDLPGYEQRIANRIDEVNDDIMTQVNTYADGTIDAMLDASEAISAVRDAGIITDPVTGLTSIFALDAYKTANDARVSNVEIDLDAVESTLTSKVTLAQVDERIAGAVFGDAGELLLSGVDARVSLVEETLDGVEAELLEKATYVEVNELGGRIGTAESRLDGHDAEIAMLATSQELDEVESRVTTAELNIDALEGSIVNKVASTVTITQDQEELIAQGLVDAMLNDREAQTDAKAKTQSALAIAESELYAHVNDEMEAEAGQRLLLAAKVDNNQATIQSESVARANADSAIASNVSTLSTTVGNNTSAIQTIDSSVDGIQSKHAVKIDTNGYVTGYELIGTGASSSMVFHVDNFLVGKPGTTNKYPFVIGTVDGVSRVSMDSAFIQDAAIENVKIANATITRLKIEGHTLTEVASYYVAAAKDMLEDATWTYYTDIDQITITTEAGYPAPITWTAVLNTGAG